MRNIIFIILGFLCYALSIQAQQERRFIRGGNRQFEKGKYEDAELAYRRALEKQPNSFEAGFNLGDALYKKGSYSEAVIQFAAISQIALDKDQKSKAFYNLGNSYYKMQQLDQAIMAYKEALKSNPNDMDAKYNLSLAMRQKNKGGGQQQQQQQDQKQDQKDDQKKEQKQEEQQQDQKKQEQAKKEEISKEDAKRMLDAMEDDEKKVQERVMEEKKQQNKQYRTLKEW